MKKSHVTAATYGKDFLSFDNWSFSTDNLRFVKVLGNGQGFEARVAIIFEQFQGPSYEVS